MARPDTVLRSIKTAIKESGRLPASTTYSIFEIDENGGQSNLRPPIVEITTDTTIRSNPHNTDLVGEATDDNGNSIGRIFEAKFEMPFTMDVWTAEGGDYNPYEIGESIRYALYQYDKTQRGDPLPNPDDPSVAMHDVDHFELGDGGVRNDLSMTPALRRWQNSGEVWFHERLNTAEEYGAESSVSIISTPGDGDIQASGGSLELTTSGN